MKIKKPHTHLLILLALCMFVPGFVFAQSITNVDFYQDDNDLVIVYDIVAYDKDQTFNIWVKVYDSKGNLFNPYTLSGDVGSDITGGKAKRIRWDMVADEVMIDEEIYVEVLGKPEPSPQQKIAHTKIPKKTEPKGEKRISVGGALALSAILPGLGISVASQGGAQWLIGVGTYGLIGGSILLNHGAYNKYEDYKVEEDPAKRNDLFTQAENQDMASKIFMGAAAVVWLGNMVLTGVQTAGINRDAKGSKLSVNGGYDPRHQAPIIGLTIKL